MVEEHDVVICGGGSAGLCAATWLARRGLRCKILESAEGPLQMGKADGVQCRTVEVYDSFGLAEELLREAYHMLEVTFWASDEHGDIVRTGRTADREDGVSHHPHVILNQARMHGILLDAMFRFNRQTVDYGYEVKSVHIDREAVDDAASHCVEVQAERNGRVETFRAKYVLGCDGARSVVRKSLGYQMLGDSTDSIWGVMDVYPRTNFPDLRKKAAIRSAHGSLLVIPKEDKWQCRFYIELEAGTNVKEVTLEDLHAAARRIFQPYDLEIAGTFWWSIYSIGQRLTNGFSKDNRVFLTGDACHTHSPKAGQGMNVSLQDGDNLGWKLAAVLQGKATPEILRTYNIEREKVAADLIEFDRVFMKAFSAKDSKTDGVSSQEFTNMFIKAGRYTAGLTARYDDSIITSAKSSMQNHAKNLQVGMRLPSTQVVRHCDANAMHLVKAFPADGRWRLLVFGGDLREAASARRLIELAAYLESSHGPVRRHTPVHEDIDSFIEPILVLKGDRLATELRDVPEYFMPITGPWRMRDIHKIYFDDVSYHSGHGKAYEFYGVNPYLGALAIVRPDQYISMVLPIESHDALGNFFRGFVTQQEVVKDQPL